jgi:hypothetical protein
MCPVRDFAHAIGWLDGSEEQIESGIVAIGDFDIAIRSSSEHESLQGLHVAGQCIAASR